MYQTAMLTRLLMREQFAQLDAELAVPAFHLAADLADAAPGAAAARPAADREQLQQQRSASGSVRSVGRRAHFAVQSAA